jgi:hypothetical protein
VPDRRWCLQRRPALKRCGDDHQDRHLSDSVAVFYAPTPAVDPYRDPAPTPSGRDSCRPSSARYSSTSGSSGRSCSAWRFCVDWRRSWDRNRSGASDLHKIRQSLCSTANTGRAKRLRERQPSHRLQAQDRASKFPQSSPGHFLYAGSPSHIRLRYGAGSLAVAPGFGGDGVGDRLPRLPGADLRGAWIHAAATISLSFDHPPSSLKRSCR